MAALPFVGGLFLALRVAVSPAAIERPKQVSLGPLSAIPESGVLARKVNYRMRRGPSVETVSEVLFLSRDQDSGEVIAMSSRCTHLGCTVMLDPENSTAPLRCPCHDARFTADGRVLEGPPPRALDRLEILLPDSPEGDIQWVLS